MTLIKDRFVKVKFISNVANSAPLYFEPSVTEMTVQVGKPYNTHYVMKNNSSRQLHTTASQSVTPGKYAEYFKKIECFCFNQQTINSGEVKDLGVQFIVDNDLPDNIGDIVLSPTLCLILQIIYRSRINYEQFLLRTTRDKMAFSSNCSLNDYVHWPC